MTIAQDTLARAANNSQPHSVVRDACVEHKPYKLNMHIKPNGQMFSGIRNDAQSANGMLIVFPDDSVLIDECWSGTYAAVASIADLLVQHSYNGASLPLLTHSAYCELFGWRVAL